MSPVALLVRDPGMERNGMASAENGDSTSGVFKSLSHCRFSPWALVGFLYGRAFRKSWGRIWLELGALGDFF